MRSPIWLRLISDVPPAMDMARCMSTSIPPMAPGPSRKAPSGPASSDEDRRRLVADLGQHELGDGALRAGAAAGDRAVGAAQVEHGHRLPVGDVAADSAGAAGEPVGCGVERGDQSRRRGATCRRRRRRC